MRTRRLAGLGLGVLATVAFGVAGCSGGNGDTSGAGATRTPSAPVSSGPADSAAASALGSAAATLGNTSFKVTITAGPGVSMVGFVDAPNNKATGLAGVDKVTVDSWGTAASQVPFTAGLDDQGRLSALTIQPPAVNGKSTPPIEVLYTDYGTTVNAQRPAASEIVEAPDNLYKALGS
jgi:hypothetical protein